MKTPKAIFLADAQSFYASVEKARNPSYANQPLVVSGDPARRSGIILAACPIAKKFGVTTAEPLWKALQKCPDLVVVRPHMQKYIDVSMQINKIYQSYTDLVEPYSCDESFLDITHSAHLFGNDPVDIAKQIQQRVATETGIYIRIGISDTKIGSKIATDLIAKKNTSGIFELHKEMMSESIWPYPVEEMWGVGRRMQRHLNKMGIYTIGDLAKTPLTRLTKRWGVNGQVLWQCANLIDNSPVSPHSYGDQKAIGCGLTLPRDYYYEDEIFTVLLENCSTVCRRARQQGYMGHVIHVSCQGADWDAPTGFSRQLKLPETTNLPMEIFEYAKKLFLQHWDGLPIRRIGVSLSELKRDDMIQLTLFQDRDKQMKIEKTMDLIKDRFGETSILRASSLTPAGQATERAGRIGGHYM